MASPSPTVFRGCLQTSTGLNARRKPACSAMTTGESGSMVRAGAPACSVNCSPAIRSSIWWPATAAVSHACRPAASVPAATAAAPPRQTAGHATMTWNEREWKWTRERRASGRRRSSQTTVSTTRSTAGRPDGRKRAAPCGPPSAADANASSCSLRPRLVTRGSTCKARLFFQTKISFCDYIFFRTDYFFLQK